MDTPVLYEREFGDQTIVVYRMIWNDRVCIGTTGDGTYDRGFCFPQDGSAIVAAETWDGTGDPVGPWIKEVGTDRYGPGSSRGRDSHA